MSKTCLPLVQSGLDLIEAVNITGASIAASRPKRKRAPTGKDYFPSHDLSFEDLHDEHDEHDAGEAERGKQL